MKRYAIINTTTNKIENFVDYDAPPGNPPPGFTKEYIAIQNDSVDFDWTYTNGSLVEPVAIPSSPVVPNVTKRQALLYLLSLGKTEKDVLAAINGISDPAQKSAALIEWNYPDGGMIPKSNPLIDTLWSVLGIKVSVDDAFIAASKL